jgi:hypothetical protein
VTPAEVERTDIASRDLPWGGCHNVRDLGGLPRTGGRHADVKHPEGIDFVRVPFDAYATPEWIAHWDPPGLPRNLGRYLEDYPQAITDLGKAVQAAAPGTVVVHCAAGRDRTGLATMLLLAHAGVPAPVILADYEHSFERLRPYWAETGKADDTADLDEEGFERIRSLTREFLATLRTDPYFGAAVRDRLV